MAKWAYVRVQEETTAGQRALIHYYTMDGIERQRVEVGPDARETGVGMREALARIIARLGEDGWELFQIDSEITYHFRRET
jgi:hypothetical protein